MVKQRHVAVILVAVLALTLALGPLACGGGDGGSGMVEVTVGPATAMPTTAAAVAAPTAAQEPTRVAPAPAISTQAPGVAPPAPTAAAPAAVAAPQPSPTPVPTAAVPQPTATPEPAAATPAPTAPAPEPTAIPSDPTLAPYAERHAGGPGAIYVGDATQLLGLPPHAGLMFNLPQSFYTQASAAALFGLPGGVPGHLFIFTSDYYQELLETAKLSNPTPLTSSGQSFEIQHVCIDRRLPTCVLVQSYWAPNLEQRTNGQVKLSVSSFAELGLAGPDTLSQVADGSLDMVNIYTGYVAGAHPALEVQSLWGTVSDWETSYLALTDLAPDVDRLVVDFSGGSQVLNRNWFAGSDQWFYSKEPLETPADFQGKKIRTHSAAMSDFIRGMGGEPVELDVTEIYSSMQIGTVDATVTTALLGVNGRLFEVSDHIAGPLIGFGYTNNVINKDVWDRMPADLQQIMIEEGAKMELEALRLAPFQNFVALEANKMAGLKPIPFSEDTLRHINETVVPEHILPGWLRRLGYPERGQQIVDIYNSKSAPYTGLRINADGTVERVTITKGPQAE
ncbi:MAG: TRAP transporter substrate-binding protein DctP [Dehalococcoidia bacterium]|nr:TRAP transporter substrate-binding protein DctP [Dehalococcoidia bacterium]